VTTGRIESRQETRTPETPSRMARWPWAVPLAIFGLTRILSGLVLVIAARDQIPPERLGTPLTRGPAFDSGTGYLAALGNWDGQWYRLIAEHGYPAHLPSIDGAIAQSAWAFYPIYPMLVRAVTLTGLSYELAATLVSMLCGAAAVCVLYGMLAPRVGAWGASLSVLALCCCPTTIALQAGYTESLALLEILVALWALSRRRYGVLLTAVLALSLTRPIVLPLALVAAVHGLARWRARRTEPFPTREVVRVGAVAVGLAASYLIWPAVAALVTHRSDAYLAVNGAWFSPTGAQAHTWLLWTLHGGTTLTWVLVGATAAGLCWCLLRGPARLWPRELRTWSWAYPLYLFAATRPTLSIVRYSMLAVVPYWPFPEAGRTTSARARVLQVALIVGVGVPLQYLWVRFAFGVTPKFYMAP
jgi:hypothetical protein